MTTATLNRSSLRALLPQITFYAFFAAVILNGAINIPAGIALIVAIVSSVLMVRASLRSLPTTATFTKAYIYFFLAYTLIVSTNIALGRSGSSGSGLQVLFPLGFLISMAITIYCDRAGRDLHTIIVIVSAVHATLLMLISFTQVWLLDLPRAHGSINAIPYAYLLTFSGGMVSIWLFQKARSAKELKLPLALLVWLIAYIFSVHLAETRGAIIAIFPLLAGFVFINLRDRRSRAGATLAALSIAIILLSLLVFGSDRFALGAFEVAKTIDGSENFGSVGMRLGMWNEAWKLIVERPITGHGIYLFRDIHTLPESSGIYTFGTVHNQILNTWMRIGMGGAVFVLLLHGLPAVVGYKLISRNIDENLGLTLIWLGGSFFTFGLTYIVVGQTNTAVILATYTPMLLLLADKKLSARKATDL